MGGGNGGSGRALADDPAPKASRWSDLSLRVASALVLLPIAMSCVWWGGAAYVCLIALCCLLLGYEYLGMCGASASDGAWYWFPAGLAAAAVLAGLGFTRFALAFLAILTPLAWAFPIHAQTADRREDSHPAMAGDRDSQRNPPRNGAAAVCIWDHKFNLAFGVPYLGLAAVALPWLRADRETGFTNTLFVLSIVWGSDIGAYLLGRLMGGPRLAPAISPGKTWSGAVGGLLSAALAGLLVAACVSSGLSPSPGFAASHVIGPAIVLGIISQAGDLLESALKRHFGVKDSGRIIPGHGGLLDRIDALLAVAPAAALLAFTVGRGVVLWR
jgi:phosphatidate cytidylyltransferase